MNFGVSIFPTRYSIGPAELARAVEERGFESLFVPEHSHIPVSRRSPWPGGGDMPDEYRETLDPFLALTAAAAVLPDVDQRFVAMSYRVPTACVSALNLQLTMRQATSQTEVEETLNESRQFQSGRIERQDRSEPLVSSDFCGMTAGAVVDAVVRLAHALGLRVVAEGVETGAQRDILLRLGCDELQGYFFAQPMSADKLLDWTTGKKPKGTVDFARSLLAEDIAA